MKADTVLRVGIDDAPPIPMQMGDPAQGTFEPVTKLRGIPGGGRKSLSIKELRVKGEQWRG